MGEIIEEERGTRSDLYKIDSPLQLPDKLSIVCRRFELLGVRNTVDYMAGVGGGPTPHPYEHGGKGRITGNTEAALDWRKSTSSCDRNGGHRRLSANPKRNQGNNTRRTIRSLRRGRYNRQIHGSHQGS